MVTLGVIGEGEGGKRETEKLTDRDKRTQTEQEKGGYVSSFTVNLVNSTIHTSMNSQFRVSPLKAR